MLSLAASAAAGVLVAAARAALLQFFGEKLEGMAFTINGRVPLPLAPLV